MPTPWDQKKKAEMARMLAEAEAEAVSSDARDEDFTFGGPEGGWEALKAGFGKEATYNFGDEAAAALSDVETTDEERIAANEEMDAVINKNAINTALGFVGGVVPSAVSLGYGAITNAATKATVLAATKAATLAAGKVAGPAAGAAAGKLAAKEVVKKITPKMAIATNAAESAVSGVGEGEGVKGRVLGGVTGATIGALVGAGTQAAGKFVEEAVNRSSKAMRSAINELGVEEATAIESAAVAKAAKEALKKKVTEFKFNEKPPDAPETLIDNETGKPYTKDYLERKRITKETERKSPALRRVIREKDVENDNMEMARRKNPNQLPLPGIEETNPAQPELDIEKSDTALDIYKPIIKPDVNVPYVDDSVAGNIEFKSLKTPRAGQSARLDFSNVDVDEDGNFITGNALGLKNKSRRPTAEQLPTDEEITSANEAASLTRAMKAKNIPLNEARLAIPGSEMPTKPSTPDAGMKMSGTEGGGKPRVGDTTKAQLEQATKDEYKRRVSEGTNKEITVKDGKLVYGDGTPVRAVRGTGSPKIFQTKENVSVGGEALRAPETYFFSDNLDLAATYAQKRLPDGTTARNIFEADIKMDKPLIVDAEGSVYNKIPFDYGDKKGIVNTDTNVLSAWARENGYDGVVVNNILDTAGIVPEKETIKKLFGNVIIALKNRNVDNPVIIAKANRAVSKPGGYTYTDPSYEMSPPPVVKASSLSEEMRSEALAKAIAEQAIIKQRQVAARTVDLPPSVILSNIQGTAAKAAEMSPSEKAIIRNAEKEYQNTITSIPKTQSDALLKKLSDTQSVLNELDLTKILRDEQNPLLVEPKLAARDAHPDYQRALERWHPQPLITRIGEPRRTAVLIGKDLVDFGNTVDALALLNKDLVPVGVPIPKQTLYPPIPGVDPKYDAATALGAGKFGTVYRVVDRNGRARVAKVSNPDSSNPFFAENSVHERKVSESFRDLRENATEEELKKYFRHFPVFHQILENPMNKDGFITVMDELRPMKDDEYQALFDGASRLYDSLASRGFLGRTGPGPAAAMPDRLLDIGLPRSFNVQPHLGQNDNPARKSISTDEYLNMPTNARKLYTALEYMADVHGMNWEDLHFSNIMVDKKTGEYVANDVGLFWNRGVKPPSSSIAPQARDTTAQDIAVALARRQRENIPENMLSDDPYVPYFTGQNLEDANDRMEMDYEAWIARQIARAQAAELARIEREKGTNLLGDFLRRGRRPRQDK